MVREYYPSDITIYQLNGGSVTFEKGHHININGMNTKIRVETIYVNSEGFVKITLDNSQEIIYHNLPYDITTEKKEDYQGELPTVKEEAMRITEILIEKAKNTTPTPTPPVEPIPDTTLPGELPTPEGGSKTPEQKD